MEPKVATEGSSMLGAGLWPPWIAAHILQSRKIRWGFI